MTSAGSVIRCAVYTRVSSEEGLKTGFTSLDNQLALCIQMIDKKQDKNWVFLQEYKEAGISAKSDNRPQFKRLIQDIQDHKIDVLLVYKLDRLVRRMPEYHHVIPILEANNVGLVSVTQDIDGSTAAGRMLINVLMTFAEFEVDQTCERQRDKAYSMRQRGMRTGGRPILGYDIDPVTKQYVVNSKEAKLVNEIFTRFAADPRKGQLVKQLNAEGKQRKVWQKRDGTDAEPGPYTLSHITRMLENRTYVGEVIYNRTSEVFQGLHQPIVNRVLFENVQTLLNQNRHIMQSRERSEIQALLKHIVFCKACNEPMSPKYSGPRERAYYEYVCRTARSKGYRYCPNPSVPARQLEGLVIEQIRVALRTDEVYMAVLKQLDSEREKALQVAKERKRNLDQMILSHEEGADVRSRESISKLTAELERVSTQCNRLEFAPLTKGEVASELRVFDRIWENLFPTEQERIAKLLIRSVTVEKEAVQIDLAEDGLASLVREIRKAGTEIISME